MMPLYMEINVLIDEGFEEYLEESWLRSVAERVLVAQNADAKAEVSLVITGQEKVQQLNLRFRGRDDPTDVLAFSAVEEAGIDFPPFIAPPDGMLHLGEVIISYPQAVAQAQERQHPVKREIAILIIHGILHLLGFEHDRPELEHIMFAREKEILD
jgi:probable rRNA maturation factor